MHALAELLLTSFRVALLKHATRATTLVDQAVNAGVMLFLRKGREQVLRALRDPLYAGFALVSLFAPHRGRMDTTRGAGAIAILKPGMFGWSLGARVATHRAMDMLRRSFSYAQSNGNGACALVAR